MESLLLMPGPHTRPSYGIFSYIVRAIVHNSCFMLGSKIPVAPASDPESRCQLVLTVQACQVRNRSSACTPAYFTLVIIAAAIFQGDKQILHDITMPTSGFAKPCCTYAGFTGAFSDTSKYRKAQACQVPCDILHLSCFCELHSEIMRLSAVRSQAAAWRCKMSKSLSA